MTDQPSHPVSLTTQDNTTTPLRHPKKKENKKQARKRKKAEKNKLSNMTIKFVPYKTFVPTITRASIVSETAGVGLVTIDALPKYTWIGFYPGDVTTRRHGKRTSHTMETSTSGTYIVANPAIKTGVHMVNEATSTYPANTFYVKLGTHCNMVLYWAGRDIQAGEELLTCYSRTYGKRSYPISKSCADPRCVDSKHRNSSELMNVEEKWRIGLRCSCPKNVDVDVYLGELEQ